MKTYAITRISDNQFYPDPEYTKKQRGLDKINYLENYQKENKMERVEYKLELLTPERLEQHQKEWNAWRAIIN